MNDYGFSYNEMEDGRLTFPAKARLTSYSLLLDEEEGKVLEEMERDMELSTHGVLKQGLRVLQMYRAGLLVAAPTDLRKSNEQ